MTREEFCNACIGDEVISIQPVGNDGVVGAAGTIIYIANEGSILCRFDGIDGHDAYGSIDGILLKTNDHWWVDIYEIDPYQPDSLGDFDPSGIEEFLGLFD